MLKLLIADDETIIRETIAEIIDWESLGISLIGTASDGAEAFEMILDTYPNIIITDVKMPVMNGLELIEKTLQMGLDIDYIILSGYREFDFAHKAMSLGIDYYLLKPCNENDIISIVKRVQYDREKRTKLNEIQKWQNFINELKTTACIGDQLQTKMLVQAFLNGFQEIEQVRTNCAKLICDLPATSEKSTSPELIEHLKTIYASQTIQEIIEAVSLAVDSLLLNKSTSLTQDCVQRIKTYVLLHLSDSRLSLKWIAENLLYMNVDYLSKLFVQETGEKFSSFLNRNRIESAKNMLLTTSLSISDVAGQVGFGDNPRYFSQVFKKYTGVKPSVYLEQNTQ